VAGPAAPEVHDFAQPTVVDGLVVDATVAQALRLGERVSDEPISPPHALPFDLRQVARLDRVEAVERAVRAVARHRRYIVRIDDHCESVPGPSRPAQIPYGTPRQIDALRTDRLVEHVQRPDGQESRASCFWRLVLRAFLT